MTQHYLDLAITIGLPLLTWAANTYLTRHVVAKGSRASRIAHVIVGTAKLFDKEESK